MPDRPSTSLDDGSYDSEDYRRVDHFILIRLLGSGGQGEVYEAIDRKLNRRVALKLLSRRFGFLDLLTTGHTKARFAREAEITAKLDHPGVCSIYEYGTDEEIDWISMQLVEGQSLHQLLAESRRQEDSDPTLAGEAEKSRIGEGADSAVTEAAGPRTLGPASDVEAIVRLMISAARALDAAHDQGLVHRDIKPGNIMINAEGDAVILDFGLAFDENADGPTLTRTGDVLGTPAYMSPEQLQEDGVRVDKRTDVYSLGVTLYECLSLRRPFGGVSRAVLFQKIVQTEAPDIRQLNPEVSRDLAVVLETAMEKDLGRRYQSCRELADDLERVRGRRPIKARSASTATRIARWVQRNTAVATLVATVFVFLTAAATWATINNRKLSRLNQDLSRQTEAARISEKRAKAEAEAKTRALEGVKEARASESRALVKATNLVREYERMADARRLENATAEAAALWPVSPDLAPKLEAWQEKYTPLVDRLAEHRRALEAIRELTGSEAAPALDEGGSWSFGEDIELQFRHDSLASLVKELDRFSDEEEGVVASISERLRLSKALSKKCVEEAEGAWNAAATRIRDASIYDGLTLRPQEGLIPLGPDPDSGLEEFLHWPTHAWRRPEAELSVRDEKGKLPPAAAQGLILVLIPAGRFDMGAQSRDEDTLNFDPDAQDAERPVQSVELDAFFIGKFEVTQAQWQSAFGVNPSTYRVGGSIQNSGMAPVTAEHPVESVNWTDVMEYTRRFGLQLPTEAQWEYAARANRPGRFSGAQSLDQLRRFANIAGSEAGPFFMEVERSHHDRHLLHAPVGSYAPNAFGLHDLSGNVMEWCRELYAPYRNAPSAGEGIRETRMKVRVHRGGSFLNPARFARVSFRLALGPMTREQYLGFRVMRSFDPGP